MQLDATFAPLVDAQIAEGRDAAEARHLWIAAAPRCRAKVRVVTEDRELVLSGIGYHDHNVGRAGLPEQFETWEWGRAHFRDRTFVYYATDELDGSREARALSVSESESAILQAKVVHDATATNVYRLRYASRLRVVADGREWSVEQGRVVDNGPFYLRFLSTFRDDCGNVATGFSEVLRPAALRWRWFWPLLDSRVRRFDNRDRIGRRITHWLIERGL